MKKGFAVAGVAMTWLPLVTAAEPDWTLGGVLEIGASVGDGFSDLAVTTAELDVQAAVTDAVTADLVLLYEDSMPELTVETATISLAPKAAFQVKAGRFVLPFGVYASHLISDPLTLAVRETSETAVQLDVYRGAWTFSMYVFNGDNDRESEEDGGDLDNYGGNIVLEQENGLSLSIGYLNDIGEADLLQDVIADQLGSNAVDAAVPGLSLNAIYAWEAWSLVAEYATATKAFAANEVAFEAAGAAPAAMNLELAHHIDVLDRPATAALAWQRSREALSLDLPEYRRAAVLRTEILDNTALSFEFAHDRWYDGTTSNAGAVQLAINF